MSFGTPEKLLWTLNYGVGGFHPNGTQISVGLQLPLDPEPGVDIETIADQTVTDLYETLSAAGYTGLYVGKTFGSSQTFTPDGP